MDCYNMSDTKLGAAYTKMYETTFMPSIASLNHKISTICNTRPTS